MRLELKVLVVLVWDFCYKQEYFCFQMILTVIAGTPGSHKDQLFASAFKEIRHRDDEWRIIRSTADNMTEEFNLAEFQKSLEMTWKESRDKSINQKIGLKKLRGILLLPGLV